ncbi:MAG: aspartate/glutamate racemase family protein [Spirochaetales bacterium]|nr:aspartate/glutamate racemase family protein [Spirochaetales bacterium]
MKTLGIIGGLSWESSAEYYRIINQEVNKRLGGVHSAKMLLASLDFGEIEKLQVAGRWDELTQELIFWARSLENAGASGILISSNTMHHSAKEVQSAIGVPLLHIADATGRAIVEAGYKKVGLLGTSFTMEGDFYNQRLSEAFDLEVILPEREEREVIHRVIYDELVVGNILPESRQKFLDMIQRMGQKGCEGMILGCTEIPLLVTQALTSVPLFDTTALHCAAAVHFMLGSSHLRNE